MILDRHFIQNNFVFFFSLVWMKIDAKKMLYHFKSNGLNEFEFFFTPSKESKKKKNWPFSAWIQAHRPSHSMCRIVLYKCLIIWIEIGRAIFPFHMVLYSGICLHCRRIFRQFPMDFGHSTERLHALARKSFLKMLRCMWLSCVGTNFIYQMACVAIASTRDLIKQFHIEMKQNMYKRDKRSKRIVWLITNCLMVGNRLKLQNNYRWFVCVLTQQQHTNKITRNHAK